MQDFRCFELSTLRLFCQKHHSWQSELCCLFIVLSFTNQLPIFMKEPQKQFSQAKLANTRRKDRLFKKQNFLLGQNNLGDLICRDWSFAFAFVL